MMQISCRDDMSWKYYWCASNQGAFFRIKAHSMREAKKEAREWATVNRERVYVSHSRDKALFHPSTIFRKGVVTSG